MIFSLAGFVRVSSHRVRLAASGFLLYDSAALHLSEAPFGHPLCPKPGARKYKLKTQDVFPWVCQTPAVSHAFRSIKLCSSSDYSFPTAFIGRVSMMLAAEPPAEEARTEHTLKGSVLLPVPGTPM